jgi:ABC-type oligopeptide transport system substrate-binding subunit
MPQYYFANLDVRRAWAYAFNYTNYINNLVGNSLYGADFAFHYTGVIPLGMAGYMTPAQLEQAGANVPVYNLSMAKQYLEESGLYNLSIDMPIVIWAGDPVDFAAAEDWAATMHSIDSNIQANALYVEYSEIYGYEVPNENPMPIFIREWIPDFPYPSDYIIPMYQENGTFGVGNGWNPQTLLAANQTNQSAEDALMNQYIADAQNTGNASLALKYYDQAEVVGVNLTFYTYTEQLNEFYFCSPQIRGMLNNENPVSNGPGEMIYIYLSK